MGRNAAPSAGPSCLRKRLWQGAVTPRQGWAQALLPRSCLAPSPTCRQRPAAAVPSPPTTGSLPPSPTKTLLTFLLQAMAVTQLFVRLLQSIFLYPQVVVDELEEDRHERMQLRAAEMSQKMTCLLQEVQELEQSTQEQSGCAYQALLFAAFQQWQFWAGLLVLLLALCWWLRKRSPEVDSSGKDESSGSKTEWEEEQHVKGCHQSQEDPEQEKEESEGEDPAERDVAMLFAKCIQWTAQNPAYMSQLVATPRCVFPERFSNTFFMVLQPLIGVGSASEGWSPCEDDAVCCLLMAPKLPRGHAFHLELGTPGEMPAKMEEMEPPHKDAAVQVPDCRESLSQSILPEGSSDHTCVRCNQLGDVLSLVDKLQEEIERLRTIMECEREIDWWSDHLANVKQQEQTDSERLRSILESEEEIDWWCDHLANLKQQEQTEPPDKAGVEV